MLLLLVFSAVCETTQTSEMISTEDATYSPTDSEITPSAKKLELTKSQKVIVFTAIGVSSAIIIAGGILTIWCRRKNQPRTIDLEQVMLPPTEEDMYAPESL